MINQKKILLYTSNKFYSNNAFSAFLDNLYKSFEILGYEPIYINIDYAENINNAIQMLKNNEVFFSLGINDTMLRIYASDKPTYVYDYLDTCHVSLLQDAPYSVKIGDINVPARNHLICFLDRSHVEMMNLLNLATDTSTKFFLPMAGDISNLGVKKEDYREDKIYDVVFCAGLWSGSPLRSWQNEADKVTSSILDCVADYMEVYPVSIYVAAKQVFSVLNLDMKIIMPTLGKYIWPLLEYIKTYRRINAMRFLVDNNIRVDVFGGGWESVPFADKINLHGQVSYHESVDAIAKAKILFQDQAEFNDGAHDRVFTAMLNGTVVVSEYSKYLDEIFCRNKDIFFYDWVNGNQQTGIIRDLLMDDNIRLKIAKSAYIKAMKKHQWINRAEQIVDLVYNKIKNGT